METVIEYNQVTGIKIDTPFVVTIKGATVMIK